ncbi:MAG: cytidylate kinase-like family protein [Christensenellaceae bacterium]|nr:cytidylate kinase-like family protein [Christensenellaceae bacterium]
MNTIITIGREFGSGGRELGRRLAEELKIAYYDSEIVSEISKRTQLSENYVKQILEKQPVPLMPITIGHSFYHVPHPLLESNRAIYNEQTKLINELSEKSDCVLVGRCADYIVRDKHPFRIFVYADMESKLRRCREKGDEAEGLSDKELIRKIKNIDKDRAQYYEFFTGRDWHDKLNYDLCINTTNTVIKDIVPILARMFRA